VGCTAHVRRRVYLVVELGQPHVKAVVPGVGQPRGVLGNDALRERETVITEVLYGEVPGADVRTGLAFIPRAGGEGGEHACLVRVVVRADLCPRRILALYATGSM
jgi:hypothetical protein